MRWSAGSIGSGVAHAGITGIQWSGLNKTLIAIVLSPMLGMILVHAGDAGDELAVQGRASAQRREELPHICTSSSSAAYSLSHGLNDAQKTMGIITVLLYSTGYLSGEFQVPHWVAIACYIAIALGTHDRRLEDHRDHGLAHHQALAAPGLSAPRPPVRSSLFSASALGIPVSTTHTITGCDHRGGHGAAGFGSALGCCAAT